MKKLTLRQKQSKFARMLSRLIDFIDLNGYECTLAVGYVPPHSSVRRIWSLHCKRLAQDINLFRAGEYLTSTKDHRRFGVYWESLGGSWGGRFKKKDGGHYSLEHNGVR